LPVELGLDEVAQTAADAATPAAALNSATALLRERQQALRAAQAPLRQLMNTLAHLTRVLPFAEEGWPQQRAELEQAIADDPQAGLARWLEYWFAAAGAGRDQALARLNDVPLPPSAALVRERAATAARGLARKAPQPAAALLAAGTEGFTVGGQPIPDPDTRHALRLLHARLNLHAAANAKIAGTAADETARLLAAAAEILNEGERSEQDAARLALLARLERLRGDDDAAAALLRQARDIDPRDLDVACEMIARDRSPQNPEAATDIEIVLTSATAAIDALQSLGDLDGDLGRLIDVPAELWLAVAARAQREKDLTTARSALMKAVAVAENDATAAKAAEALAVIAETAADRLEWYTDAGYRWMLAEQLERALLAYDTARAVDAGDAELAGALGSATILWADTVATIHRPDPYATKLGKLKAALAALTQALPAVDITGEDSWAYLVDRDISSQLAASVEEPRAVHLWRALLAAERSAALLPAEATRWWAVSDAADGVGLGQMSLATARLALELQRDQSTITNLVRALANAGYPAQASELLGELGAEDAAVLDGNGAAWVDCVRGYLALMLTDADEALRIYTGTTIPPQSSWAWTTYVMAVTISGDVTKAATLSENYLAGMINRSTEVDWLFAAALDALLHGDAATALGYAQQLTDAALPNETRPPLVTGASLLLGDDPSGGRELIATVLRGHDRCRVLEWERLWRPLVKSLARHRDLPTTELDALNPLLRQARARLPAPDDPAAELRRIDPGDDAPMSMALALGIALVGQAGTGEEIPGAIAAVAAFPQLQAEADSLRANLADIAAARLASEVLAAAGKERPRQLTAVLEQLLGATAERAASLLRSAAGDSVPGSVLSGLRSLVGRGALGTRAAQVLELLTREQQAEDPPSADMPAFTLELPLSWFDGMTDPLREHDLFVRYLPELRARVDWTVPSINVTDNADLEPGGFRVLSGDTVLAEGAVDPARRYCQEASLRLLPAAIAEHPGRALTDYGWSIPAEAFHSTAPDSTALNSPAPDSTGGLAELLTMSAVEVVARAVGEAARSLDQPT
jgi:hypothetical protein